MKAIETRYAGCRFRSRLEARWAVFFDHLGIEWDYEPQGFELRHRLSLADGTFPYLPDFRLPRLGVWVEVKGSLTREELERLLEAAAALSNPLGGCAGGDNDLVVLGNVPRVGRHTTPTGVHLHMHKGSLLATPWSPWGESGCGSRLPSVVVSGDDGEGFLDHACGDGPYHDFRDWQQIRDLLIGGFPAVVHPTMADAYEAARSARFEYGQVGAP